MPLKLHEAIAVVLLNAEKRTATISEISDEINRRELYQRRDGDSIPDFQVMMRTKLSDGKYAEWFEWLAPNRVRLK